MGTDWLLAPPRWNRGTGHGSNPHTGLPAADRTAISKQFVVGQASGRAAVADPDTRGRSVGCLAVGVELLQALPDSDRGRRGGVFGVCEVVEHDRVDVFLQVGEAQDAFGVVVEGPP